MAEVNVMLISLLPRSNCVLNTDKATKAGVGMRHIRDAMNDAILLYGMTEDATDPLPA